MELTDFWGKIRTSPGNPISCHPLICHMIDVGQVAGELWRGVLPGAARATLANSFGLDEENAAKWFSFLAALHDLGKATPSFQLHPSLSRGNRELVKRRLEGSGLPCPESPKFVRHGIITGKELPHILTDRHGVPTGQAASALIRGWRPSRGVSHHRRNPGLRRQQGRSRDEGVGRGAIANWRCLGRSVRSTARGTDPTEQCRRDGIGWPCVSCRLDWLGG